MMSWRLGASVVLALLLGFVGWAVVRFVAIAADARSDWILPGSSFASLLGAVRADEGWVALQDVPRGVRDAIVVAMPAGGVVNALTLLAGEGSPNRSGSQRLFLSIYLWLFASNDDRVELLLNRAHFGRDAIGISSACVSFFGRPCRGLGLAEQASIVAALQRPRWLVEHPRALAARRNYLLRRMSEQGSCSRAALAEAEATDVVLIERPRQ